MPPNNVRGVLRSALRRTISECNRSRSRVVFPAVAALLLIGNAGGQTAASEPLRAIRPLTIEAIEPVSIRRLSGSLQAAKETALAFPVAGTVQSVEVEIGDRVDAGEVLATLDDEPYRLVVEARRAEVVQARAQLSERREHYERQSQLLESGWISDAAYEQAEALFETARGRLELAERQLELVERDLEDTRLIAPFAGTVPVRQIEPFQEVTAGQPVLELQDASDLEVLVLVPEPLIPALALHTRVMIDLPAIGVTDRLGRVDQIGSRAVAANAFPVIVSLDDPEGLWSGMTAEVTFVFAESAEETSILVPPSAILGLDVLDGPADEPRQETSVFLYDPDTSTLMRVPIEIRDVLGANVAIAAPLSDGDIIAAAGVEFLHDGQRVTLLRSADAPE